MPTAWTPSRNARIAFGALASTYWLSLATGLILVIFRVYPTQETNPNLIGFTDTPTLDRLVDWFSYFTIWSSFLVAGLMTQIARGRLAPTRLNRVLLADALLMVSITGIIFQVLLRGLVPLQGLQVLTDAVEHAWGPLLVVVAWVVFGPRRWLGVKTVFQALIIPLIWLGWTFVRFSFVEAWPYPFVNVTEYGLPTVMTTIGIIILFGIFLGFVFLWIDRARLPGRLHFSDEMADEVA